MQNIENFYKILSLMLLKMSLNCTEMAYINSGGSKGAPSAPTLRTKIFLISCSFWENLGNLYVGALLSYGQSWIRP